MDERAPTVEEDGVMTPGDPLSEAGGAVEDAYNLRLTALLYQLVRKRGHKGAARTLGIDHRTVSASVKEGLSRRVRDALEGALVERGGAEKLPAALP